MGTAFTGVLIDAGVRSLNGRPRPLDRPRVHRTPVALAQIWDVYLKSCADGLEARAGIGEWIAVYNERGLHQALNYRTPVAVFR